MLWNVRSWGLSRCQCLVKLGSWHKGLRLDVYCLSASLDAADEGGPLGLMHLGLFFFLHLVVVGSKGIHFATRVVGLNRGYAVFEFAVLLLAFAWR